MKSVASINSAARRFGKSPDGERRGDHEGRPIEFVDEGHFAISSTSKGVLCDSGRSVNAFGEPRDTPQSRRLLPRAGVELAHRQSDH